MCQKYHFLTHHFQILQVADTSERVQVLLLFWSSTPVAVHVLYSCSYSISNVHVVGHLKIICPSLLHPKQTTTRYFDHDNGYSFAANDFWASHILIVICIECQENLNNKDLALNKKLWSGIVNVRLVLLVLAASKLQVG